MVERPEDHLSRGMKRHIRLELSVARKVRPGLTRKQLMHMNNLNGPSKGARPESEIKGGFCTLAQRHCLELNNPYVMVDFCLVCPEYTKMLDRQLKEEFAL